MGDREDLTGFPTVAQHPPCQVYSSQIRADSGGEVGYRLFNDSSE